MTGAIVKHHAVQVQLKRALEEMVDQQRRLYELSPDAIMRIDENVFTDCNSAALKMFGCTDKAQFVGRHPGFFSPKKQPSGKSSVVLANQKIKEALSAGSAIFEWRHSKLDGGEFDTEVCLVAYRKDEKLILQATVRDITARKKDQGCLVATVEQLNNAIEGIVMAISKTMGFKDQYTTLHQKRVSDISCAIAELLNWDEAAIKGLRLAALVHDIGKISTPTEILTKPLQLSPVELALVQEHAEIGYQILKDITFPWDIAEIVHQHHERLDGSGYPRGLKGDEILPAAKVIAVADTIEAMAAHRPYKLSVGLIGALAEIKAGAGTKYDPEIVQAALQLFKGRSSIEEMFHDV